MFRSELHQLFVNKFIIKENGDLEISFVANQVLFGNFEPLTPCTPENRPKPLKILGKSENALSNRLPCLDINQACSTNTGLTDALFHKLDASNRSSKHHDRHDTLGVLVHTIC